MRAIVVEQVGGPDVLALREVPDPRPGPGELLVAVAAAGVNYIDTYHRGGLYPVSTPFTPGVEGAGTVEAVGEQVEGFAPGQRVAWTGVMGSYAERVVVPADRAVPVPDGVDLETAAAVMLQGMTAHYLTHDTYALREGDQALVHAGAGGVGRLVIQMAGIRGAAIATTVSTAEKARIAAEAGADLVIRYDQADFVDEALAAWPDKLHVVYDGVGQATFLRGLDALRLRGMMVLFGQASGPVPPFDLQILNQKGSLYVTRPSLFHYIASRDELMSRAGAVLDMVRSGRLAVLIGARFPLSEAAAAHRDLEGRRTVGKVLLIP